jgi:hypothetical protein
MKKIKPAKTHRAATPDLAPSTAETLTQRGNRATPKVSGNCDAPDFMEGQEDPAQSKELERQQDA